MEIVKSPHREAAEYLQIQVTRTNPTNRIGFPYTLKSYEYLPLRCEVHHSNSEIVSNRQVSPQVARLSRIEHAESRTVELHKYVSFSSTPLEPQARFGSTPSLVHMSVSRAPLRAVDISIAVHAKLISVLRPESSANCSRHRHLRRNNP